MSGQLESAVPESASPGSTVLPQSPPSHRPHRALVALIVVGVLVVCGGVIALARRSPSSLPTPPPPAASSAPSAEQSSASRVAAIAGVLRQRSAAIISHNRAAFVATLDPAGAAFRRSQTQMFDNLAMIHFASWSYSLGTGSMVVPSDRQHSYGALTWAPTDAALHYRIAGFDSAATNLPQYPTFVQRAGHWYLASLSDFTGRGDMSATDLWNYAPVDVIQRSDVLVLGPQAELATMRSVAARMQIAVPRVTAVWGRDWARRVVVQVPATQHEMGLITADTQDLDQIAALTSAEISTTPGRPAPVGDRVTINPANWSKLGAIGAEVTLTHELTHVASRAQTGAQTPKWLAEGFANYVGYRDTGLAPSQIASELAADVQAGKVPRRLPTENDFRGSNTALAQAYEGAWLACRYIADTDGQAALVRFYRAVGTSHSGTSGAVASAMRTVLHLTPRQFQSRWRDYLRQQLAS